MSGTHERQNFDENETHDAEKSPLEVETLNKIKNGEPLLIRGFRANGDFLLAQHAYKTVLTKLCLQESIDPANLKLSFSDPNLTWGRAWSDEVVNGFLDQYAGEKMPPHFVQKIMLRLSVMFHVLISSEDLNSVPTPEKMDRGALEKFDPVKFLEAKREIDDQRNKEHQRVVIVQSGSLGVKRLSDEDVISIAKKLKALDLPIDIWVVSDKKFMETRTNSVNERTFPDFRNISDSVDDHFEIALADGTVQGVTVDSDINNLTAGLAGDYIIGTDAFYNHLAFGGQKLAQLDEGRNTEVHGATLYTIFPPEEWQTAGSSVVKSNAFEYVVEEYNRGPKLAVGGELVAQNNYLDFFGSQRTGISEEDVNRLAETACDDLLLLLK